MEDLRDPLFVNFNDLLSLDLIKNKLTDVDFNIKTKQYRMLFDETTSVFTDVFFSDIHLLNFINYIYNTINSYIMSNLNKHLKINNYDLLYENEEVLFVFKGGNNMCFLYKYVENMNSLISNLTEEQRETLDDMNKEFSSNFKISDCDFSVYIICNSLQRYLQIYFVISKLLVTILDEIAYKMDQKLSNVRPNIDGSTDIEINDSIVVDSGRIKISKTQSTNPSYKNILYWIKLYKNVIKTLYNRYSEDEEQINYIPVFRSLISPLSPELHDINIISLILHIINALYYKITDPELLASLQASELECIGIKNRILSTIESKLDSFYDFNKISVFKKKLLNKLNDLNKSKPVFYKQNNKLIGYKINEDLDFNDIKITKRKSFILQTKNNIDGMEIITGSKDREHYLSVNNIINDINIPANNSIIFDLYRIKFNVVIKNRSIDSATGLISCSKGFDELKEISIENINIHDLEHIKIPAEFVDVSISKFYDSRYQLLIKNYYNNQKPIYSYFSLLSFPSIYSNNIIIYSFLGIFNDLNELLYDYLLKIILDAKYKKRVARLVYFLILHTFLTHDYNNFEIIIQYFRYYIESLKSPQFPPDNDIYYPVQSTGGRLSVNYSDIIKYFFTPDTENIINNKNIYDIIDIIVKKGNITDTFSVKPKFIMIKYMLNSLLIFKLLLSRDNNVFVNIALLEGYINISTDLIVTRFNEMLNVISKYLILMLKYITHVLYKVPQQARAQIGGLNIVSQTQLLKYIDKIGDKILFPLDSKKSDTKLNQYENKSFNKMLDLISMYKHLDFNSPFNIDISTNETDINDINNIINNSNKIKKPLSTFHFDFDNE